MRLCSKFFSINITDSDKLEFHFRFAFRRVSTTTAAAAATTLSSENWFRHSFGIVWKARSDL
jgi:hypothetical protein